MKLDLEIEGADQGLNLIILANSIGFLDLEITILANSIPYQMYSGVQNQAYIALTMLLNL